MIKRNVQSPRTTLQRSSRARKDWQRLLAVALPCLGLASSACLSDISISDCAQRGDCGASHAGNGGSGSGAIAGGGASGGFREAAGVAGESGSAASGGTPAIVAGAGTGGTPAIGAAAGSSGTLAVGGEGAGTGGTPGGDAGAGDGGMAGEGGMGGNDPGGPWIPQAVLTPSCAHHSYSKMLTLFGTAPPYQWQMLSNDWTIAVDPNDSSRAKLSRDDAPSGTNKVTVKLTDFSGRRTTQTLTVLQARDTCYFAFTAVEGTDSRLTLLDPLAETPAPEPLHHNQGVFDFQFSPDGQFLAYRHGADSTHPTGQHIALVTLSSLQETELSFQESSIATFSWSPDSSVLAVAFVSNGVTYLGGVRAPTSNAPIALVPNPAPVQSELYWIGNSYVAFHANMVPDTAHPGQFLPDSVPTRRTAYYAILGQQGFGAPNAIIQAPYFPGIHVQPSPDGFFVITDQDIGFVFYQLSAGSLNPVDHFGASLVSPSGRYSASNTDATLQLFSADDGWASPSSISKEGEDCPKLLAWAKGVERIACVADVPNDPAPNQHGVIRIFDLKSNSDTLEMAALGGHYSYGMARAAGNARAFSDSGRWLAFTTSSDIESENFLYLADLNKGFELDRGFNLQVAGVQPSLMSTDLAFSPDENLLLLRRGTVLSVYDLTAPSDTPPPVVGVDLVTSTRCTENFAAQPDAWCGNTARTAALRWSADSKTWAYRSPGKLTVVNGALLPALESFPLNATDCDQQCTSQFAFQPPIAH